ncbi:hypothetical protein D7249_17770 [Stutzerimonas stutzeri]
MLRQAMPKLLRAYTRAMAGFEVVQLFAWLPVAARLYNPRAFSAIEPENPQC